MDNNLIEEITNSIKDVSAVYYGILSDDSVSFQMTEFEMNLSSELETTLIGLVKSLRIAAFKMSDSL